MAEARTRDLAVIGGGVACGRLVVCARLVSAPQRLRRAALPVARARERDRVAVAVADFGEMGERGRGIIEEAQGDPAGGELMLGAVVVLARDHGVARDAIGGLILIEVEKLAGDQTPLDPPLIRVDRLAGVVRHRQDQLGGLGCLVGTTKKLGAAENVSDVAMRFRRCCIEQRLGVRGFVDHGDARPGDDRRIAAGAIGGAQPPFGIFRIEPHVHARLVVGQCDETLEDIEGQALEVVRELVIAPGLAHQALCTGAVALQQQRAGERELSLRRGGPFLGEERAHESRIETVCPQRGFSPAAQQADGRPARIVVDESHVAAQVDAIGAVAAQDCPFNQLAGDRIVDGFLEIFGLCVVLPRRATFTASFRAAASAEDIGSPAATANRAEGVAARGAAAVAFGLASAFAGALAGLGFGNRHRVRRVGLQRGNDGRAGQQRGQQS